MGWWWFGGDADEKRASEIRSGAVAPTRTERRKCWESRDAYFACLDRSGIVDAIKDEKEAASACAAQSSRLDRDCAAEWVTHFKRSRLANYQKEQRLKALQAQGATPMQIEGGPGGPPQAKT